MGVQIHLDGSLMFAQLLYLKFWMWYTCIWFDVNLLCLGQCVIELLFIPAKAIAGSGCTKNTSSHGNDFTSMQISHFWLKWISLWLCLGYCTRAHNACQHVLCIHYEWNSGGIHSQINKSTHNKQITNTVNHKAKTIKCYKLKKYMWIGSKWII